MTTSPIMKIQDTSWVGAHEGVHEPLRLIYRRIVERQLALMDTRPLPFQKMCVSQAAGLVVALGWRDEQEVDQSSQVIMMGWSDDETRDLARLTLEHVILEVLCRRAMEQTPSGKFIRWDIGAASRGLRAIMHLEPGAQATPEQLASHVTAALLQWMIDHPALEQRLLARVVTG